MAQFLDQRHRGTEGFGVFDRTRTRLVRATKEKKMLGWLKNHESTSLMFHHRFPTSTRNRKSACHPFSTKDHFDSNYVLIHNGHISNSRSLRLEHEKLGIQYHSWDKSEGKFNDSESLLWDVALYLEGKQSKLQAYGNIAFVCLEIPKDKRKTTKLHFARNTNPLNMLVDEGTVMLSSEGEGNSAQPHKLYTLNYKTLALDMIDLKIPSTDPEYVAPVYQHQHQTALPYTGYNPRAHEWSSDRFDEDWDEEYERWKANAGEGDDYEWDEEKHLEGDVNGKYELIPSDEDYSWNAVHNTKLERVNFRRDDGVVIDVRSEVFSKLNSYLETVDGEYMSAYSLIGYDLHVMVQQLNQDRELDFVDDEDLVLEIDLLRAAREAMDTCTIWTAPESVDARYATV